jgi:hypothetical protein
MPLKPAGSPLTFTLAASSVNATVVIDGDIREKYITLDFIRKEWSNAFLMDLQEADGSEPIYIKNVAGGKIQIDFDCGDSSGPRSVATDDNNLNNIMKKFTIQRYSIKGGPSSPSAVESLLTVSRDHTRRLAVFDSYIKRFDQKLSYGYVYGLRTETFSYLTTTGLSASGATMSQSNILIRDFDAGSTHENPRTATIVAKDWSMTVDVITLIDSQLVY